MSKMPTKAPDKVWRFKLSENSTPQFLTAPTDLNLWGPNATLEEYQLVQQTKKDEK